MIAPIDKIKNLLTDDVVTLFGDDILNNSFTEAWKLVNRLMTDSSVYHALSESEAPGTKFRTETKVGTVQILGWSDNDFLRNRRIIHVNRLVAGSSPEEWIQATKIEGNLGRTKAGMASSLYYENDEYNPKYYSKYGAQIGVLPDSVANDDLEVFFHTFPVFGLANQFNTTHMLANSKFSTLTKDNEENIFIGIPYAAREFVYIQMALNLIQYYMSDFVHDEEDTELASLLASQVVSLDKERKEHLQFVVANYGNDNFGDME